MNGVYHVYFSDAFNSENYQGEMVAVNAKGFDNAAEKVQAGMDYEIHVFKIEFREKLHLEVIESKKE